MNVAIYVPFCPHGGSLKNLQQLLNAWKAKAEHRIVVVAPQKALDAIGTIVGQGAIQPLMIDKKRSFGLRRVAFERRGAATLISTVDPDVVFAPGGTIPNGLTVPAVANFQNVLPIQPHLWRATGDLSIYVRQRVLRRHLRQALDKTDVAIFNSQSARDEFANFHGRVLLNSVVIPRAVASADVGDTDAPHVERLVGGPEYFVTVGQIYAYRNLVPLIRGYGAYVRASVSPRRLVIIGRSGSRSDERRVSAAIRKQAIGDLVVLLGHQPPATTLALMRHARLHLFSSSIENCPNALLEAMAIGTPTVCARASANPEFAQDAVVYVDPRRADDWTRTLCAFADDEQLQKTLSQKGRIITENLASADQIAAQTWKVLCSAADRGRGVAA